MKKNKIFLKMAALAVMGTMMSGCAEEIEALQTANQTVIQKFTISLADDAGTRGAITIDTDSKKGITTFSEGDMIAVIYQNANGKTVQSLSAELTPADLTDEGASATFTVELNNPLAGGYVRYIYPASMAAEGTDIVPGEEPSQPTSINYTPLATQDGTLETIASSLGLAVYDGQMSTTATLPTGTDVKLENRLAIGKFTIYNNDGSSDLTSKVTKLTINDGTNTYTVNRTASAGPIYVAMQPVSSSQTVTLSATVLNATEEYYYKSVTNNALAASNIYDINVNAIKQVDLSRQTAAYEAKNGDVLTGELDVTNHPVKISIADGAAVTLNGVTINGVDNSSYSWAGITCLGDATIILANGSTNTVKGFSSNYSGIFVAHNTSGTEYTLTIDGDGSLNASTNTNSYGNGGAGIGGGLNINCGNIIINGGNITATGGGQSPGIGGGIGVGSSCGNITINGGTINATGGYGASGIGCGVGGSMISSCGNITISGGTITATGGYGASGIGNSYYAGICSNVTINATVTKVTARRGDDGATIFAENKVIIGGTVYKDGDVYPLGDSYLYQSEFIYPEPQPEP